MPKSFLIYKNQGEMETEAELDHHSAFTVVVPKTKGKNIL